MSFLEKVLGGTKVEWKTLGEIAKVQRGASPRPIAQYITDDTNGIPWIRIGDTSSGSKYVKNTSQRITIEGAKKSRVLKKGDFIISNSMSFGRPYILDINGAIHDGWASISNFEEKLNSDFLYHYLSSNVVQNYWLSKINSGSVSNLNADIIKTLLILFTLNCHLV
jgi:type I restriction enzyme S subunit